MGNIDPLAPLRDRAVMCKITATAFGSVRVDKERSTSEFKIVYNLLKGVDHIHKKIVAAQVEARLALRGYSLPYGDEEGWRILPRENLNRFGHKFEQALRRYNEFYYGLIANAKEILAAAPKDAETAAGVPQLLKSYSLDCAFQPFPDPVFPGYLTEAHRNTLEGNHNKRMVRVMEKHVLDAVTSPREAIARLVDRTSALNNRAMSVEIGEDVGRTGAFKERIIDDLEVALSNLSVFNFIGDERIVGLIAITRPLRDLTSRGLRADKRERDVAVSSGLRAIRHIDYVVGGVAPRHA